MIKVTVLLINNKSTREFTDNNAIKEQKRDSFCKVRILRNVNNLAQL